MVVNLIKPVLFIIVALAAKLFGFGPCNNRKSYDQQQQKKKKYQTLRTPTLMQPYQEIFLYRFLIQKENTIWFDSAGKMSELLLLYSITGTWLCVVSNELLSFFDIIKK